VIGLQIEENEQYRINTVKVVGVKNAVEEAYVRGFLGFKPGDIYNEGQMRKAFDDLKKFFGSGGYINFNIDPSIDFNEDKTIDLTLNVDEGKQYTIHRINFYGNTTTRDKVIRRELSLGESFTFNSNFLKQDILRINQLGFFEEIKEDDAHVDPNDKDATVDINIKVSEKGKTRSVSVAAPPP
jgi:outer membrane protein insertion porin family